MTTVQIHPQSLCEAQSVGSGSVIEAFARVARGVVIGEGCSIASGAVIGAGAQLADRVVIGAGSWIAPAAVIEADVSLGPNVTLAGGRATPASEQAAAIVVRAGATIEAGSTLVGGITVGRGSIVEAGSMVARSVPPYAVVAGNPAEIRRNLDTEGSLLSVPISKAEPGDLMVGVRSAKLSRFAEFSDLRGSLTAGDIPSEHVPFEVRRWFVVYDVPTRELRGEHAHRRCHQFLICVAGTVAVALDDGEHRTEVVLDSPALGVHVPPMVWSSQLWYESSSVLLVLTSDPYDPDDYIREYERFLVEAGAQG